MGWGLPIWPPKQWSRTGCLPRAGCDSQRKIKLTWFYCGKTENGDLSPVSAQSNCNKTWDLLFHGIIHQQREHVERHHCLEKTLSVSQSLNFLLLWSLKLIKLTSTFKFSKQKALFQIHHVRRLAVNCDHQNHPHYRHQQHKHRGVQAIYRVRWRWPTFALGGCLGKLSVGLFNQPLHHLNHYHRRHSRWWPWWCWVERGLEGSLSVA